jgi:hypothetical protein
MAIRPLKYEEGKTVLMPCANTQTIVTGDALVDNGSGYLALATSSTAVDIHYVAMQTVTTTADAQFVLCLETENVLFEADTDGTAWLTAEQGTYCDIGASAVTTDLDTSASTNDLFYIVKGIGTSGTDTKVVGFFTRGIPNS